MLERLHQLLAQLRLQGMAQVLEAIFAQADAEALSPAEVMQRLLEEEWRHPQERSLAYRLTQARLPWEPRNPAWWSRPTSPCTGSRRPSPDIRLHPAPRWS
jgi:DNA replication protein DnaC